MKKSSDTGDRIDPLDPHRPIESRIALNDAQIAEIPPTLGALVPIHRFVDERNLWQIAVGPSQPGSENLTSIGMLYSVATQQDVEQPLYLCSYPVAEGKGTSASLDRTPHCSHAGELIQPEPIGYVSEKIRTGFLLAVRCRSKTKGLYVSLNPRCESPEDQYDDMLGSIRAAH